jgi:hypothetical protein
MRLIDIATQALNVAGTLYRAISGNWDIFDADGKRLIEFDTFFSFDAMSDAQVTQAPVENGEFASYNKQIAPTRSTVVLGYTGSSLVRAAIIKKCGALIAGTDLVSIITPDRTLMDMSLVGMDYSYRAEHGIDRLVVALIFEEVRQVAAEYTTASTTTGGSSASLSTAQVKNSADASTRDVGKQTTQTPRTSSLERARQGVASWL